MSKGASSLREDRAGHASHGAAAASPPYGDHPIARFTPGPWEALVEKRGRGYGWSVGGTYCVLARVLALQGADYGSAEANARLIAAAPDLYEALGNLMGTSELNDENRAAMAEAAALRRRVRGQ